MRYSDVCCCGSGMEEAWTDTGARLGFWGLGTALFTSGTCGAAPELFCNMESKARGFGAS